MAVSARVQGLIDSLEAMLSGLQHIPVYHEPGIPKEVLGKRTLITFAYDNWNTDYRRWFYLNNGQRELTPGTDFTLDSDKGEITLLTTAGSAFADAGELPVGQEIEASYHFKYFTEDQFVCFLQRGLDNVNNRRPVTRFGDLDNLPAEFDSAVILYAYYRALTTILLDNQIWNNHLIWATNPTTGNAASAGGQMFQQVDRLKEEAWREWELEAKFAKERGFVKPRGISGGRFATQQRVTGSNFQRFTIIGSSL